MLDFNFPTLKMSSQRQLCFNTLTDQICLQVTPLTQAGDVLQTQAGREPLFPQELIRTTPTTFNPSIANIATDLAAQFQRQFNPQPPSSNLFQRSMSL